MRESHSQTKVDEAEVHCVIEHLNDAHKHKFDSAMHVLRAINVLVNVAKHHWEIDDWLQKIAGYLDYYYALKFNTKPLKVLIHHEHIINHDDNRLQQTLRRPNRLKNEAKSIPVASIDTQLLLFRICHFKFI